VDSVATTLARLGLEPRRITEPATLDGGDVMAVVDTVYVGLGGRTNADGVHQLGKALEPAGLTVVPVELSRVLHLKSAVTALPDGTVIGWPEALDDPSVFPRFLAVPEEAGAHVVRLGDGGAARAPRPAAGPRRHRGVREAGGVCDLPVGPHPGYALTRRFGRTPRRSFTFVPRGTTFPALSDWRRTTSLRLTWARGRRTLPSRQPAFRSRRFARFFERPLSLGTLQVFFADSDACPEGIAGDPGEAGDDGDDGGSDSGGVGSGRS
jgi:hypothetical protein